MTKLLRPVGHEDQLSLVDHLDELRSRIIVCLVALGVSFAVCFWQNGAILEWVNAPIEQTAFKEGSTDTFEQAGVFQQQIGRLAAVMERYCRAAAADTNVSRETRARAQECLEEARRTVAATPQLRPRVPITTGVGEPFFVTFKVAGYAALLLCMPILLWQAYAFILPAFSPRERRAALPLMAMVPFLFVAGVAFAYFVVLPNAVDFLQNFNDDEFDILLRADDYVRFVVMVLTVMGILFQIPVGILLVVRMEILTVAQLRANRRYALLVIAVLAMLLPGTDPVTMLIAMAPLLVLFEGSILLAAFLARRAERPADPIDPSAD